jgi:MFS family permease
MSAIATDVADRDPRRWRILALLATAELLGMSLWFAASAVATQLADRWSLGPSQTAWLTTIVQLGFVCGTAIAALLNLADLFPSKWFFAVAALAGASANAALVVTDRFAMALVLRFATGFMLAGVYPPAMKMASTWFRARRGLAIGTVVGALTVGKATPYLVHAFPAAGPRAVILVASICAVLASLLIAAFYIDGPYPFPPRRSPGVSSTLSWNGESGGWPRADISDTCSSSIRLDVDSVVSRGECGRTARKHRQFGRRGRTGFGGGFRDDSRWWTGLRLGRTIRGRARDVNGSSCSPWP